MTSFNRLTAVLFSLSCREQELQYTPGEQASWDTKYVQRYCFSQLFSQGADACPDSAPFGFCPDSSSPLVVLLDRDDKKATLLRNGQYKALVCFSDREPSSEERSAQLRLKRRIQCLE